MSWHPEEIGGDIRRELARLGPAAAIGEVVSVWPDAVGAGIAANAWPARWAGDGTLHVAVSSSAWAFELTQLEATIRARLEEHLGKSVPKRLRFAVGRLPEQGNDEIKSFARTVPKLTPDELAHGERLAAAIENPELRAAVARAAAASLARGAEPGGRP
jgi:hypothetical protein